MQTILLPTDLSSSDAMPILQLLSASFIQIEITARRQWHHLDIPGGYRIGYSRLRQCLRRQWNNSTVSFGTFLAIHAGAGAVEPSSPLTSAVLLLFGAWTGTE